jgi:hypothetical protein
MNSMDDTNHSSTLKKPLSPESSLIPEYDSSSTDRADYEDLQHIARKREIRITIRQGTKAGVAAGLSVMAGVIMAGPPGAIIGAAVGGALAHSISRDVVSLNDLLQATPVKKRHEILKVFHESFKEEFIDTIQNNPELRLVMGGQSIFGVMRYMVDRELLQNDQLVRLDKILRKVV